MPELRAGIISTGSAVPSRIVSNAEMAALPGIETTPEWIKNNTGIEFRWFADEDEATSLYAARAGRLAVAKAGLDIRDIDLIMIATTTPDRLCGATAPIVQNLLGATCGAFDVAAGCSGFGYALAAANGFVVSGMYRNVLVVGADLLSKITNYTDRTTCLLLGDAAGAVVVGRVEAPYGIDAWSLGADGGGADKLYIPSGGSARALTSDGIERHEGKLWMDGHAVFKFAVQSIPRMIRELCEQASFDLTDVDLVVPHQANKRIIVKAQEALGDDLPIEKFLMILRYYGNTSAASIPLALDKWAETAQTTLGKRVLITAFGAGLTTAGASMVWAY